MVAHPLGWNGYGGPLSCLYQHVSDVSLRGPPPLMYLAHLHLLLNHWPIIGSFIGLGIFLVSLIVNSDDLKQTSLVLFVLIALLAIPTYMSGNAAEEAIRETPGISKTLIQTHQGAALLALLSMQVTGAAAL